MLSRGFQKRPSPAPGPPSSQPPAPVASCPWSLGSPLDFSSLLPPARIMCCLPVPQRTGQGITNRGLSARPLTPTVTRNETRWGLVCPICQHVLTVHLLGGDTGQASDPWGWRERTGVWWLRCELCYVLAEFQALLIMMLRRRRNDNFLLSIGSFPSA